MLILKITGLFDLALKAFKANNNKIVNNSRANKMVKNLFKSRNLKNFIKLAKFKNIKKLLKPKIRYLEQLIFLNSKANNVLFLKY